MWSQTRNSYLFDSQTAPVCETPSPDTEIPHAVRELARSDDIIPTWVNELGGLTCRVDRGTTNDRYIKWVKAGTPELDLALEAKKLLWAEKWIAVPSVIDYGTCDDGSWLITDAIDARSAVDKMWREQPEAAVTAIARGIRTLHDALPAESCPFDWSLEHRIQNAIERTRRGANPVTVSATRRVLRDAPPTDKLVVCHGDPCAPNTLLHDGGSFAAHVDMGSLGVADRWADLAVASWSLEWNYGPGYDGVFYDVYGIQPDEERIRYYRLLWELS